MKSIQKLTLASTAVAVILSTTAIAQEASDTNDPMQGDMSGMQGIEGMMPMMNMMNMMQQMGPMMKACTEMMQAMTDHSETGKPETNEG